MSDSPSLPAEISPVKFNWFPFFCLAAILGGFSPFVVWAYMAGQTVNDDLDFPIVMVGAGLIISLSITACAYGAARSAPPRWLRRPLLQLLLLQTVGLLWLCFIVVAGHLSQPLAFQWSKSNAYAAAAVVEDFRSRRGRY